MSQIHHLLFHSFVLRLHILLLHCQGADNAVIKENEGLGSNTPFCRSSEVPREEPAQPHISPKAIGKRQHHLSYFWLCLIPGLASPGESIVWLKEQERSTQGKVRERKVVKRFLTRSQYEFPTFGGFGGHRCLPQAGLGTSHSPRVCHPPDDEPGPANSALVPRERETEPSSREDTRRSGSRRPQLPTSAPPGCAAPAPRRNIHWPCPQPAAPASCSACPAGGSSLGLLLPHRQQLLAHAGLGPSGPP